MGDYHTIGAQRDRATTWSFLERIAVALEQIAGQITRQPTADDIVAYLHHLRDEGCTYTEIGALTKHLDIPVTVEHDGETCPIHESA